MRNLYIFHPTTDLNLIHPNSILLNRVGITLTGNQYHTSLGDLSAQQILSVVTQFDIIEFVDTGFDQQSAIYQETVNLLNVLSHRCVVKNFSPGPVIDFISRTEIFERADCPLLWVFGCSHSHGVGLDNGDQRYSVLLSQQLSLPLKSITQPGSSIEWSLRHLMQADIRAGDTVIWQLTTPERFSCGLDFLGTTKELLLKTAGRREVDFFTDEQIFYHHINFLNIGLKFLRKQQIKFAFISLDNVGQLNQHCIKQYVNHDEYCYLPGYNVDLGNDNAHYGPQSHLNLASGLAKFLMR